MSDPTDASPGSNGLGAVPGLVRVGAELWWHTTGWALKTSLRSSRRLLHVAASAQSAADLAAEVQAAARNYARELIDLADHGNGAPPTLGSLHDRGEELIRKSRDVRFEEEAHPAYERILGELAPDEGRILLLLLTKGPQPAVDVRTGGPLGMISSKLIAPGLSMIGSRAGLRYVDRVPAYLNNLFRLGMIWFSRETLHDPLRYQVLEAQPDVLAAIHSVRQAKLVRRSIHLTPFGEDFCRTCLPLDTAAPGELPEHSTPDAATTAPQPPAP
jgi:hypothetical protein